MSTEEEVDYWRIPASEELLRTLAASSGRTIEEEREIDVVRRRWVQLKVMYERKQKLRELRPT